MKTANKIKLCGGAFYGSEGYVRCAFRNWDFPYYRFDYGGFRVANTANMIKLCSGSFTGDEFDVHTACRLRFNPLNRFYDIGFRVCKG